MVRTEPLVVSSHAAAFETSVGQLHQDSLWGVHVGKSATQLAVVATAGMWKDDGAKPSARPAIVVPQLMRANVAMALLTVCSATCCVRIVLVWRQIVVVWHAFFSDVASSHDKIERLVFRSMHFCLGVETFGAIVKGTGFSLSGFDCGAGLIAKPTGFLFGVGVLSGAIYGLSGSNPAIPCIAQWTANMQATIKVHLVYLCCWMKNMEHVF